MAKLKQPKFVLMLSLALILATSSTLSFNVSAQTTHNEEGDSMDQSMSSVQALQNNLLSDFMPDNYREVAQKQVLVDKVPAELIRYARTDGRNNAIGGEHFSTVIDTTGKLKGFARMDADLIGKELPSKDDAYNIAMQFLQRYAPDLLENLSLKFVAEHSEPVFVSNGNNTSTKKLTGMKVKMRNLKDDLYFWVIIGADRKVIIFERDIYWANLPYGHRRTEQWLHDNWLKDKQKINEVSDI